MDWMVCSGRTATRPSFGGDAAQTLPPAAEMRCALNLKGDYLASTGYLARNHSRQPPFRAYTFLYPSAIIVRARPALEASLGQAQ